MTSGYKYGYKKYICFNNAIQFAGVSIIGFFWPENKSGTSGVRVVLLETFCEAGDLNDCFFHDLPNLALGKVTMFFLFVRQCY